MDTSTGLLVSFEGISGSGKTYFVRKLIERLGSARVSLIKELSDRAAPGVDKSIIAALHFSNDRFLRLGVPKTETFLLLALKIFDAETAIQAGLQEGRVVVEDRSIDTIAVYQSIMLCNNDDVRSMLVARELIDLASRWRKMPDLTFLITDDFIRAISRAEERSQRPFSEDELEILRRAATIYDGYAKLFTDRIIVLDRRRLDEDQIIEIITDAIEKCGR